jgi:hypothetical protein
MRFWFKKKADEDIDAVVKEFEEELPSTKVKRLPLLSRLRCRLKLNALFARGTNAKSAAKKEKSK